jgi:hypothetical protein
MIDATMYRHMQRYRQNWYEAKAAVQNPADTGVDADHAHQNYHCCTEQWVTRLLPLDTVEDVHQEIWHDRQLGPYTGLKDAYEDGLEKDTWGYEDADLLDVVVLTEIGKAAEEITVDVTDLPEQPPVDPDPWDPDPNRTDERLKELNAELPDDIDMPGYE